MRAGATLVTNESPTGDRYSSPIVRIMVFPSSHITLRRASGAMPCAATIITMYESPIIRHPLPILTRLDGSLPRFACQPQNIVSSGANRKIIAGLKAWNHVEGIFHPNGVGQCVF